MTVGDYQIEPTDRFFSELADFAPVMIWRAGPDGLHNWFNKPWLRFVGRTLAQEVGNGWAENIHPADFDRCIEVYGSSFDTRRPFTMTYRLRRYDGHYRDILDNGAAFYNEGEFAGYFGSCVDLTDFNAMESQLRDAQRTEAVGQFTGSVANGFNNLLTALIGSLELFRRPDITDAQRERYIDTIGDTAESAVRLTAQLLAFSRRQTLATETFDIVESIDQVAEVVRSLVGSGIEVEVEHPPAPLWVNTDRSEFDAAILNLVNNARDAMKEGGKLVIASTETIAPRAAEQAASVPFASISVVDSGTGIPENDLERVFEPFFTTKRIVGGTGLGLSQVKRFANQAGGDVLVKSAMGRGSAFTLRLPRVDPPPALSLAADAEETAHGSRICVLVVEDNDSVGDFTVNALHELGYESILARDADEALRKLDEHSDRIRVVFSDVVMPGKTGDVLGELIRRKRPDISIVLTSGYSEENMQNAHQSGFELLRKPFSIAQLSSTIRRAGGR